MTTSLMGSTTIIVLLAAATAASALDAAFGGFRHSPTQSTAAEPASDNSQAQGEVLSELEVIGDPVSR